MQQYTGITISICPFFEVAQACFYLRLRSKTYRFGHTPVEGRSDGTRGKPQNSPCAAPEGQQKTSETRIQSKAVPTFHTLRIGWRARFQSSSPCSIIHASTNGGSGITGSASSHYYEQHLLCYLPSRRVIEFLSPLWA